MAVGLGHITQIVTIIQYKLFFCKNYCIIVKFVL